MFILLIKLLCFFILLNLKCNFRDESKVNDETAQEISKRLLEKIALRNKERFLLAQRASRNKRQNKIKSRNFHRHIKGRTMKEYEKEIEFLRQNDPREYANRIVKSELNRVRERASLRHRSGSKFAKLQKLRAKYDNEVSIFLLIFLGQIGS